MFSHLFPKKKRKFDLNVLFVFLGLFVIFFIVCLLFGINFLYNDLNRFPQKTYINGVDCSNLTPRFAKMKVESIWNSEKVQIKTNEETSLVLNLSDCDVCYKEKPSFDYLLHHLSYKNKLACFFRLKKEFSCDMTLIPSQNKKFCQVLDGGGLYDNSNRKPSKNAFVDLSTRDFHIVKEQKGTKIDSSLVLKEVSSFVEKGKFIGVVNLDKCVEMPKIVSSSREIKNDLAYDKENLSFVVSLNFGNEVYELTPSDINLMADYHGLEPSLDEEEIEKFVKSMAKKYNEYNETYSFTTTSGKKKKIKAVTYGRLLDQEKEMSFLKKALSEQKTVAHDVSWSKKKYQDAKDGGIGDTYAEVSIKKQKVWFYKNGKKILSSPCVTGRPPHLTPTGLYVVDWKSGKMTLRGYNDDGSKYENPVNCFIPFNGGIGFHGADGWRSEYGGDIYKWGGSHGCVNMPDKKAWKMYKNIDVNTPVVVY